MRFDSLQFITFCIVAILLLRTVPVGRLKDITLLGLNLLFLSSFVTEYFQLVPLLFFVVFSYAFICFSHFSRLSRSSRKTTSSLGLALLLTVVTCLFIWLKHYSMIGFIPQLQFSYLTVGLSYILFRIIQVSVDVSQGEMKIPSFIDFFNFIFFFLTFVSGPIQRFQDFSTQFKKPKMTTDSMSINLALERIILGYFMINVLCSVTSLTNESLLRLLYLSLNEGSGTRSIIKLYSSTAITQAVHLYLNFSGYMNICIGIGCLTGFILPENFNKPYQSKNLLDFWSRWHITLSDWFKCYIFNPILKALSKKWSTPQNGPYLGAIAFFVTFFIMGIWHGTSILFVFYGLFLASGVTLNKFWQIQMSKKLGKVRYKKLCQNYWYCLSSRAITLSFFSIALTCIWFDPAPIKSIPFFKLFIYGINSFFALSALLTLVLWQGKWITKGTRRITRAFRPRFMERYRQLDSTPSLVWLAVKIFILINLSFSFGDNAPEFVYKGF